MTVEVKIHGIVSTQRYGTLESGNILRTDPEYARFLVEDCQAGEYVTAPAADENKQEEQATAAPKRARKSKEIPQ